MPTIIDSLLIELGIDASKMSKGAKESAEALNKLQEQQDKASKETEIAGKKMAAAIGKFRNELLSVVAVFTAGVGLKEFFNQMTNADSATGRLAKNIDTSVDKLTAWQGVAERSGGSAEGIAGSMQGLTQQFQQLALTGQSSVVPYFRAVGVAISDINTGKLRPLGDIFLEVSDKFKSMDPARAQALGRGMGFDEGTVNVLMQGGAALRQLLAEQEKIGHANDRDAKSAQERQAAMRALGQASRDAGRKILTDLTPAILEVLKLLSRMGEWFKENPTAAKAAIGTLTAAITLLSAAMAVNAVAAFASMALAGVTAFGSIAASALPLMGVIAALGGGLAVGTGIGVLIDKGLSSATNQETSLGSFLYDVTHGESPDIAKAMKGTPRGIRNNNPGNLNYAGQPGASKENGPGGRFAVFSTMLEGLVALKEQLLRYGSQGIDTISAIINKYAPSSENDTAAYIKSISKKLGIGSDAKLNLRDDGTMRALIEGITTIENGRGRVDPNLINAAVQARNGPTNRSGNNVQAEVHVGQITVQTQATDAKGIARDMGTAMNKYFNMTAMANYGLA